MPNTATVDTAYLPNTLKRIVKWLLAHPGLPVSYVHYADHETAELCIPAGRYSALTAAADVADALTAPQIEVMDPLQRRITYITVTGRIDGDLEIGVHLSVYDDARAALLASLGAPPEIDVRAWIIDADHLRGVGK